MTRQSSLLPNTEKPKRERAKTLRPVAVDLPVRKLTTADEALRDANLAKVRAYRDRQQVGDIRIADRECSTCGGELIEELVSISEQGGRYYEALCLKCHPSK